MALAVRADSADPAAVVDAVDRVARELGRLDVLVNNAGLRHENVFEILVGVAG